TAIYRANVSHIHDAGVDPDAYADLREAALLEFLLQCFNPGKHLLRRRDRILSMGCIVQWSTPEGHDHVPHILVDRAVVGEDDFGNRREEIVEQGFQLRGRERLRNCGEVSYIREEYGHFATLARKAVIFWMPEHRI